MVERIERLFPGLVGNDYRVTSPCDVLYNCIAWAAGVTTDWWWPAAPGRAHWPEGVAREETVTAFREAFASLGYGPCDGDELVPGMEKVALFADREGTPTHAARQLVTGRWTSNLGRGEDIEHRLRDLEGEVYGTVSLIMARPLARHDESTPK